MALTSPTESRLFDRRDVPLLLSSFPIPPSHIPSTPMSSSFHSPLPSPNPPLSRPPSTPLPPVPGPSPITEHETLLFISAARLKRASKLSLASTCPSVYSHRDSVATLTSVTSSSAPPLSPIMTHADPAARTLRSFPSTSSLSHSNSRIFLEKSPTFAPRICEEDSDTADLTHISIPDLSPMPSTASSSVGFSDTDEEVLELGVGPSLSRRPRRTHRGPGLNDSISSIELRDLPALQEEADLGPVPPITTHRRSSSLTKTYPHLRPQILSSFPRPPTAVLNKDLPPLPLEEPEAPTPTSADYSHAQLTAASAVASSSRSGASSPDIATIIATTPKPRRRPSSPFSGRSKSRSRPGSARYSTKHGSGGSVVPVPSLDKVRSGGGRSELAYVRRGSYDEDEEDYGQVIDGTGTVIDWRMLDAAVEARLERELEGYGSDEGLLSDGSDSSIDVHTPLPDLMLRDGMLSPYSKLLQQSRAPTPHDKHMSIVSTAASIMTKSGIYKDERDTTRRRVRHRDGKLLRGGIGLTTGLGWSDSEDEDAPSPLTRRVSSMVLSRRTSANSLSSSAQQQPRSPHPLSRSVSDTLTSASASLALHQARIKEGRPVMPPTAWTGASASSASSTRTSTSSAFSHCGMRTSDPIAGHTVCSLDDIKEQDTEREEREKDELGAMTPSSASSSSLPMPLTPVGDDDVGAWAHAHARDKQLFSAARKIPSKPNSKSSMPFPRERTTSSSSHGSLNTSRSTIAASASSPSTRTSVPRPLRLTQSSILLEKQPQLQSGLRKPTVARSTSASTHSPKTPRARTASGSKIAAPPSAIPHPHPHTMVSQLARPSAISQPATMTRPGTLAERKPRTGTGMTYRTSNPRPSLMRAPSSSLLRTSASSGTRI